MRWINSKTTRWAATAICTTCWSYALVARFTNFFMAPRLDKIILLGAAMIPTGLFSLLIFHSLRPRIASKFRPKAVLKTATLSALAAAVLLLFFFQPLYFPEHHLLEIMPCPPLSKGDLTIFSIYRVELPGGEKLRIPPFLMDLQNNWQVNSSNGSITWTGGPEDKISFTHLMQAGIEIVFKVGPQQGKARILWNSQEHLLDLNTPIEGTQNITLMPTLDWSRADLTRKVLVGFAMVAEFLGLSILICISSILPRIFSIRNSKTIIICTAALLLLLPLVYAADPPVQFQDTHLETAVREILDQPSGIIRQHKLLTIARLDASSYEIASLDGIQYLRNLASLNLRDNHITEITRISQLTSLQDLNLRGNAINDITPLTTLTKLESLNLRDNPIKDLSPLSNLTYIRELNLHGIPLENNIELLENFPNLTRLNVRDCAVTDISLLAKLMALGILQNDPLSDTRAEVDIRDNPIQRQPTDGYASIRPFWERIYDRVPFVLPVFNTLDAPTFSHIGGFYEEDFWLVLSTQDPQTAIHYTLDGSEPTQHSSLYNQPLQVSSRIGQPNKLSAISTITPQWKEPSGEVFKATVIRAKVFHPDGSHSATGTQTYFVDPNMAKRYTLPIMSIIVDPDHFFDYDKGIYVTGHAYDPYEGRFNYLNSNYNQRGGMWERPAHIEFFSTSGIQALSQDIGVRIHGASIRHYPQKSLRLIADDRYGQWGDFENKFFSGLYNSVQGDPITQFKTLLLRNSGNNSNYPLFRDNIMHALISHTALDTLAYYPVLGFLNGEYWGIYNMRENLDEHYLAAHYQIEPHQVVIMERNSQINFGEPSDAFHYQALLKYIRDNDTNDPEHYNYIATQMDIDNFIDYQIAEIYSANKNWPSDNIKYWRYKNDAYQPDAPYGQDGRWRWLLFDLDTGFGYGESASFQDNTLLQATGEFLIRSLFENSEFRRQFINRFADHLNTSFAPQRVISIIDKMQSTINPEMPEHIQRWRVMEDSMDVWDKNVGIMRSFVSQRPVYVRLHILDYFNLTGTADITLLTDSAKGHIRINSIDITTDTPGVIDTNDWSGTYFEGVPISLSAIPNPGFQFAGWIGIDLPDSDVNLVLNEDLSLTANFIPADN